MPAPKDAILWWRIPAPKRAQALPRARIGPPATASAPPVSPVPPGVAAHPPRIHQPVGEVGQQVGDDNEERVDHHHALQHRVVALVEGADDQLAEARPVEDDLGQHRIADQDAEIESDHGHHRDHRVAERVPPDHDPRRHALRPRRADVILAQHAEHARTRDAHDVGHHDQACNDRRQDQRADAAQGIAGTALADHREPAELDGEGEQQQDRRDEGGKRQASKREQACRIVERLIAAACGGDAKWQPDHDTDHQRAQRELDGIGEDVRNLAPDRSMRHQRRAEVPSEHRRHEVDILDRHRLVEAELVPHRGERLRTRA